MNDQMTVSGLPFMGWLKDYHVAKESEEKAQYTMNLYGIKFSDVKYPYLTALGSTSNAGSRAFSSAAVTVSKNLTKLYR